MDDLNEEILSKISRYCAYQERCHQEVRSKLLELGCFGEELEAVIAWLIQENFLNEERFANLYAQSKFRQKKWGKNKITHQLKLKNISPHCIQKSIQTINKGDYQQTLYELTKTKLETLSKSEKSKWKLQQKVYTYLQQKGYESALIIDSINEILKQQAS